jgi:hypothetical protein
MALAATPQLQAVVDVIGETKALSITQCEQLPTPRLLAYFKKHRPAIQSRIDRDDTSDVTRQLLSEYTDDVRTILSQRENVE